VADTEIKLIRVRLGVLQFEKVATKPTKAFRRVWEIIFKGEELFPWHLFIGLSLEEAGKKSGIAVWGTQQNVNANPIGRSSTYLDAVYVCIVSNDPTGSFEPMTVECRHRWGRFSEEQESAPMGKRWLPFYVDQKETECMCIPREAWGRLGTPVDHWLICR
jgi:hypothetical protein